MTDEVREALKGVTLEQLQEAAPHLLTEYAERLEADSKESAVTTTETAPTTPEGGDPPSTSTAGAGSTVDVEAIVKTAVESAVGEVKGHFDGQLKDRDKQDNRERLELILASETRLKDASKSEIRESFADAVFERVEATDDTPAMTGAQVFTSKVKAAIEEKHAEIKAYLDEAGVTYKGVGPSDVTVAESGTGGVTVRRGGTNAMIEDRLGIAETPEPVGAGATTEGGE